MTFTSQGMPSDHVSNTDYHEWTKAQDKMKIDFSQIATHALTMLVAAVFIGAAGYLWKGIEGIDDRINRATADLRAVQEVISPKLDKVESRLTDLMLLVDPVLFPADLPGKKTQELINDNAQQQVQQRGTRP